MALSVSVETPEAEPFSSIVYQVTPTPASVATSSRRNPATRRRAPSGNPTSLGRKRLRRSRRKSPSSRRRPLICIALLMIPFGRD